MTILTVALLVFITVACLHALNAYITFLTQGARGTISMVVASVMIVAVCVVGVMAVV